MEIPSPRNAHIEADADNSRNVRCGAPAQMKRQMRVG